MWRDEDRADAEVMRWGKVRDFVCGQTAAFSQLAAYHRPADCRIFWFHAASLGEYAVLRPLIRELKRRETCSVVLTFFSPTGVNALCGANHEADFVGYLPLDTPWRARRFLATIRPDVAVFAVSELWPNYLRLLTQGGTPTFLVAAHIARPSKYFAWYGGLWRRALHRFTHIFVTDEASSQNLTHLGITAASVMGNPLFDNACAVAASSWSNDVVERFCAHGMNRSEREPIFIAGSLSDRRDLQLVTYLANTNPELRFIVVPHELDTSTVLRIQRAFLHGAVRYTMAQTIATEELRKHQCLIVDTIGFLPYLYRYATYAYVGGGFTSYLHSVIEATVYGVPVAFGPRIERKVTPKQLTDLGIGQVVTSGEELEMWWKDYSEHPSRLSDARDIAQRYITQNRGVTHHVADFLLANLSNTIQSS